MSGSDTVRPVGARSPRYHAAVSVRRPARQLDALARVAPGTPLREGLDRIVKAKMGALVVVGDGPEVLSICSGGFLLDAPYSPQRLSELAKMDGAIILAADASRIARANVHLQPGANIPTSETGTRHRTAERVARSVEVPVISVSEDMGVIAIYVGSNKQVLEEIPRLLSRSNQAIQTLERYRSRLDEVEAELTTAELEDTVAMRDVAALLRRSEMVRRIAEEIEGYIVELGVDARLIRLQLDELMGDAADDREYVAMDYVGQHDDWTVDDCLEALASLSTDDLLDLREVASTLHQGAGVDLDQHLQPRGWRMLARIPRLPESVIGHVVERFGTLQKTMRATVPELVDVEGVGDARAKAIKEGLARLAQSSVLDRYH
jgi:diadenylate cyclase